MLPLQFIPRANNTHSVNGGEYRYGFNGMEKDDEVAGQGNSYTTEFRKLDVRIGRWFSLDPKTSKRPDLTPYRFGFNCPILFNDPNGDYEVDGKLNGAEKKAIRQKHKDSGAENWKDLAKQEIKDTEAANVQKIHEMVQEAKELLLNDEHVMETFTALTGASPTGTEEEKKRFENFFEHNRKGPLFSYRTLTEKGEEFDSSAQTSERYGDIALGKMDENILNFAGITILHEYIHYAGIFGFVHGDASESGYENLETGNIKYSLEDQLNVLNVARKL